jgi:hypothetical protein
LLRGQDDRSTVRNRFVRKLMLHDCRLPRYLSAVPRYLSANHRNAAWASVLQKENFQKRSNLRTPLVKIPKMPFLLKVYPHLSLRLRGQIAWYVLSRSNPPISILIRVCTAIITCVISALRSNIVGFKHQNLRSNIPRSSKNSVLQPSNSLPT